MLPTNRLLLALLAILTTTGTAHAAPKNDKPADAFPLSTTQRSVYGTLVDATADPAPQIMASANRPSVWYRIDDPTAGGWYVDTAGSFRGRSSPRELLVAVFTQTAGGAPVLLAEGGKITVDGVPSLEVSGFRFDVPAGTGRLLVAVAAVDAEGRRDFRLNFHRFSQNPPNPIVVTPPLPELSGAAIASPNGGLSFGGEFEEAPVFAIYNALSAARPKARIRFTHDFAPGSVTFETAPNTVVHDNQAIALRPKTVHPGPHHGEIGSHDHHVRIEARNPVTDTLWAKRSMPVRYTVYRAGSASGIMQVTASQGFRVGALGERVAVDVTVRNLLGEAAKGCFLTSNPIAPEIGGGVYKRDNVLFAAYHPVTGDLGPALNRSFDIPNAATRRFRVTAEARSVGVRPLHLTVRCAAPFASTSASAHGLHPMLYGESTVFVFGDTKNRDDADVAFVFDGSQASAAPRLWTVDVLGTKRFAVLVTNRSKTPRTLTIGVGGAIPGFATFGEPIEAEVCLAAAAPSKSCAGPKDDAVPVAFKPDETRRIIVTLSGKGVPVAEKVMENRLFVRVLQGAAPVGLAGFAVATD